MKFKSSIVFPKVTRWCSLSLWLWAGVGWIGALSATAMPSVALAQSQPGATTAVATTTVASASGACPKLLQHTLPRLQDEKPQTLCQYAGQVVLVVNTASYCGFTSQYKGLESLYARYKDRGLVVLGFPSNDFSQEPDSNNRIADFCENTYGVKFPMFAKSSVRGAQAIDLFKQLSQQTQTPPRWNFYKYLISRDGHSVKAFNSMTAPDDKDLVKTLEKMLADSPVKAPATGPGA
jgi:glutathione peroxidase